MIYLNSFKFNYKHFLQTSASAQESLGSIWYLQLSGQRPWVKDLENQQSTHTIELRTTCMFSGSGPFNNWEDYIQSMNTIHTHRITSVTYPCILGPLYVSLDTLSLIRSLIIPSKERPTVCNKTRNVSHHFLTFSPPHKLLSIENNKIRYHLISRTYWWKESKAWTYLYQAIQGILSMLKGGLVI